MYPTENELSLLDIENELSREQASKGQRFANYLVDAVIFYIIIVCVGVVAYVAFEDNTTASGLNSMDDNPVLERLFGYILYLIYYLISEGVSQGRTFGKLVTKTRVIKTDGTQFTWKDALMRSLIRIIPFEPFSVFSESGPWHDKWTQTMVVRKGIKG